MRIVLYETFNLSPAWQLMPETLLELQAKDCAFPHQLPPDGDLAVLIAYIEDEMAGYLAYDFHEDAGIWFIQLSYVQPSFRRQGVHTKLFETLVDRAKLRGDILAIESSTHWNNGPAQRAFKEQGRQAIAISYRYPIKAYPDPSNPLEVDAK